ncbi:hypothetical protein BFW38_02630 [Terasakiispira papahanaumokuakeensis]|uniref:Uncharacterized protein n=1 Tax=Terasakiispira papahanaumokuakeensis TaxID=197479 RepID=A0A1E2V6G1_9GAMM|nr:hypothetical protein [Terasakiispira papahanaumokuakeensis]ODC02608.1 hypothetical protein BFW38_02630 [Terasakiispira papahanaumokuakeensis]
MNPAQGTEGDNVKKLVLLCFVVLLQGCGGKPFYLTTVSPPVELGDSAAVQSSKLLTSDHVDHGWASIGDKLLTVEEYGASQKSGQEVAAHAPTRRDFPRRAHWSGLYRFNVDRLDSLSSTRKMQGHGNVSPAVDKLLNKDLTGLTIFTTPDYYRGAIGVILDEQGHVATEEPLIQVTGGKAGRRWAMDYRGPFFVSTDAISGKPTTSWSLFYSGYRQGSYVLTLTSQTMNSQGRAQAQPEQTLYVSEQDLRQGTMVKGLFIQALAINEQGMLKLKIEDRR